MKVPLDDYLLGIGDVAGELARYAINAASSGDIDVTYGIRGHLRDLHGCTSWNILEHFDHSRSP